MEIIRTWCSKLCSCTRNFISNKLNVIKAHCATESKILGIFWRPLCLKLKLVTLFNIFSTDFSCFGENVLEQANPKDRNSNTIFTCSKSTRIDWKEQIYFHSLFADMCEIWNRVVLEAFSHFMMNTLLFVFCIITV